jgi:peptide/nickel transport system substrate-binding protein
MMAEWRGAKAIVLFGGGPPHCRNSLRPARRSSRRLTQLAFAAAAVSVLACGRAERARESVLRIPLINDPILNPVVAPDLGSILVNKVIFPGLVRPDEQLRPTPDLAESWTQSDDGLSYTFRLRPGVRWHDGQPFGARDVQFTFEQIVDAKSGSRLRSDFAAIAGVDVVDSLTVRFRLKAPFAPFLSLLGYNAGILPEHILRGLRLADAADFNRAKPIGTGPFMVTQVVPGSSVVLSRNPGYYGARPSIERIVFRIVPDINVQVAQLRAGELDVIQLEPANTGSVQGVDGVKVVRNAVVQHYYVGFNLSRPLFASPLVRRALVYAVNRDAIVHGVMKGYADPPRGTIPVALKDYFDATLPPVPYAPDSALALLGRSGWTRGPDGKLHNTRGEPFRFTLLVDKGNPTREQSALAVQQDLKHIGMDVSLQTLEFASVVRDYVLPGKFDANLIWWTTPPDPDQFAFYHTGEDNNNVRYSNARVDSLLAAGRATTDTARRREIYAAFQAEEMRDPPVLVLFYPREILAVSAALQGMPALGLRDALRWSERFGFAGR